MTLTIESSEVNAAAGGTPVGTSEANEEKEQSESSEVLLAQLREQFRKKEIGFKNRIKQLTKSIGTANDKSRQMQTELSFALATTHNEYGHLEKSQREQVMKKDL